MAASYLPVKAMLPPERIIDFVVAENEAICQEGREVFADESALTFLADIPTKDDHFDIVHFGSSLQYVEKWEGLLLKVKALSPSD